MINTSDELNRRWLNLPAVKPCECASHKTLISSLISISSKISAFISHDSSFPFTSNKRNAKTITRLIEVLQVLLSELQTDDSSDLYELSTSSLSELYVVLQKIYFLLHDCTRLEARVWMLINSWPVSGELRSLVGSFVAALEDLNTEERDFVSFLISQGKRARFEVERDDFWASNVILSAMDKFENRVIPNPNELRRVMEYLDIKNWSDCNKQVLFLEEETGSTRANRLRGLMVYCRCVLFQSIDDGNRRLESKRDKGFDMGFLNPDDFKCPISFEIMVDPVTISSGQTYDRSSIVKWFKSGNMVCPKTGQKLESLDLVPNLAVKQLMKHYSLQNGISVPVHKSEAKSKGFTRSGYLGSLAAREAMRMVADFLSIKLAIGTTEEKSKAAYEIKLLTERSAFKTACLVESRVVPLLLNLLLSNDSTAQENAIAALLNLSKHSECKAAIVDNKGLSLVIRVLKSGINIEARQKAAAVLFYLSSVEEYRRLIGNKQDAIPSLVELIQIGGDCGKKNALVAILSLLLLPSNHHEVLKTGLVPILVSLLGIMESGELVVDSLAVLSALAENPDGASVILSAEALNTILGILCASSSDSSRFGKEHCVSLLLALCRNCGREVVKVLVKNTSLMGALYSLLTKGTSRGSKKANSLISILLEFSERNSSQSMAQGFSHKNFIHVW